jgi:hypothetical protein
MKKFSKSLMTWFLALLPLFILAGTVGLFFVSNAEFALGVGGICATLYGASYQFRVAKEREANSRLFAEKSKAYEGMINIVLSLFKSIKGMGPKTDNLKLAERLMDVRAKLIVWGAFDTIKALDQLGDVSGAASDPKKTIRILGDMYEAMRRDLGHSDPPGSGLEIALGNIHANERDQLR